MELDETIIARTDTEQQAINRIEISNIWDKVQALPEKMKQVVELRLLSNLAFKEIGQMLGKSENWARVTFYRAKLMLIKENE